MASVRKIFVRVGLLEDRQRTQIYDGGLEGRKNEKVGGRNVPKSRSGVLLSPEGSRKTDETLWIQPKNSPCSHHPSRWAYSTFALVPYLHRYKLHFNLILVLHQIMVSSVVPPALGWVNQPCRFAFSSIFTLIASYLIWINCARTLAVDNCLILRGLTSSLAKVKYKLGAYHLSPVLAGQAEGSECREVRYGSVILFFSSWALLVFQLPSWMAWGDRSSNQAW